MKRLCSTLVALSVATALMLATGCGGTKPPAPSDGGGDKDGSKGSTPTSSAKLEPVSATGAGTVEGKIVYDGTPPAPKPLDMSKDDTGHCKKAPEGEQKDQTWVVDANGGVANVVVWVQEPKDKFFPTAKDKARKDDVTVAQPFCAFEPHVFALQASYYDADSKQQKPTGSKLKVINNAPIPHNSNVTFDHPKFTSGKNELLPGGKDPAAHMEFTDIKTGDPKKAGTFEKINIGCNVHPWMKAYGMAFDHPFFAVTKDGSFKIENVPAGTELEVMYWHESMATPKSAGKVKVEDGKPAKVADVKIK